MLKLEHVPDSHVTPVAFSDHDLVSFAQKGSQGSQLPRSIFYSFLCSWFLIFFLILNLNTRQLGKSANSFTDSIRPRNLIGLNFLLTM